MAGRFFVVQRPLSLALLDSSPKGRAFKRSGKAKPLPLGEVHGEAVTERASRLYSFSHASKTACLFSRSFLRSRRPSIENRAAGIGSP